MPIQRGRLKEDGLIAAFSSKPPLGRAERALKCVKRCRRVNAEATIELRPSLLLKALMRDRAQSDERGDSK